MFLYVTSLVTDIKKIQIHVGRKNQKIQYPRGKKKTKKLKPASPWAAGR